MLKTKLVLTGGQCAGKTTLVNYIRRNRNERNEYIIVSETAMLLYKSRLHLGQNISNSSFQKLMILIQYYREAKAERLANESKGEKIIICDRGILDPIAYMDKEEYYKILEELNLDYNTVSHSYDHIIFMESLAVDNPRLFKEKRNGKNVKEAQKRNNVLKNVWSATGISFDLVDNVEDYMEEKARLAMHHIIYSEKDPNRCELAPMSKRTFFKKVHEILKSEGLPEDFIDEYLARNGI